MWIEWGYIYMIYIRYDGIQFWYNGCKLSEKEEKLFAAIEKGFVSTQEAVLARTTFAQLGARSQVRWFLTSTFCPKSMSGPRLWPTQHGLWVGVATNPKRAWRVFARCWPESSEQKLVSQGKLQVEYHSENWGIFWGSLAGDFPLWTSRSGETLTAFQHLPWGFWQNMMRIETNKQTPGTIPW